MQDSEKPWPEAILIVEIAYRTPGLGNGLGDQVFGSGVLSGQPQRHAVKRVQVFLDAAAEENCAVLGFGHAVGPVEFQVEGAAQGANFWVWIVENTYFEGTQRTLFSILFGAGVIILTSRAEKAGGGIKVQNESNCKTDCPACSRVCPEAAIMFPKYQAGPINGDEVRNEDYLKQFALD